MRGLVNDSTISFERASDAEDFSACGSAKVRCAITKAQRLLLESLPPASTLIADRGCDSQWFRDALEAGGVSPCIPPTRSRKIPLDYDKTLYRPRHKIENLFVWLEDWRRIAARYDRCAHTFFSTICIAAAVAFHLNQ